MRYGNCVSYKNINQIKILKEAGFDYIETALSALYTATEREITEFISALDGNKIKCEAVNGLFPSGIALTGEQADFAKASDYINLIFEKTKKMGFKRVVFGSGGARKYPEGFPKEKAIKQIIEIIKNFVIPAAEKYDFTLAIEELNRGETNLVNTFEEAKNLAEQINHPRVKVLADLYHMGIENENTKILRETKNTLAHCHIANPYNKRYYPHASDGGESKKLYAEFFENLKYANYNGGISIEGGLGGLPAGEINAAEIPGWVDKQDQLFYAESKKSLEYMKGLE